VKIDGTSAGALTSYTFSNVTTNHTISAGFSSSGQPPLVDAGPNQVVTRGTTVILNGANSRDQDGYISSYLWTQTGGTSVVLRNANAAQASFTAPTVGPGGSALTFKLTVKDSAGLQATDTCIVNVIYVHQPPTAKVGQDQTVSQWAIVTLDGSKSTDSEGSGLSYLWEQIAGAAVTLSAQQSAKPTFVAPEVDSGSTALVFRLTVTDVYGLKSTETSIVNVTWANTAPQAITASNLTVSAGAMVTLDGSGSSDQSDGIVSFGWHQVSGPPVMLSDPRVAKPTFTAPNSRSDPNPLIFVLTVSDAGGLKSRSAQSVTVKYTGPDLTGTWANFSNAGGSVSGVFQISNIGTVAASGYTTAFYLSNDGVSLNNLLSAQTVYNTSPGAKGNALSFRYTGSNLSGKYIIVVIDSSNAVQETNEINNVVRGAIP